jgi:hypothetical protein
VEEEDVIEQICKSCFGFMDRGSKLQSPHNPPSATKADGDGSGREDCFFGREKSEAVLTAGWDMGGHPDQGTRNRNSSCGKNLQPVLVRPITTTQA